MNTISPASLQTPLESQSALTLLDVRTPPEFQQMHVPRAELVPLDRLDPADRQRACQVDSAVPHLPHGKPCSGGGEETRNSWLRAMLCR